MTGLDRRPARASKADKAAKVRKVPAWRALPCPPGCALVPADLLKQLQSEVSQTVLPKKVPNDVTAAAPAPAPAAPVHVAPAARRADDVRVPKARPRPRDPGRLVLVKHAAVGTEESEPEAPVARSVAVEEGTQTTPEQPVIQVQAPPVVQGEDTHWLVHIPSPPAAAAAAAAQPSPDAAAERFDLFGVDRFTAEKERERKRLQAQMLAEQIEEQRERKEEELRRKREEEQREERRLARELREMEERHRHDDEATGENQATPKVPGRGARRRKSKDPAESRASTQLRGDSSAGPWDEEERRRRRRRRRNEQGPVQDGSWQASERDKRTWRDASYLSHSMLPDGRDTSQSPVPWLSPQEEEGRAVRRRRRRERTSDRRGDSYDANDTWEAQRLDRGDLESVHRRSQEEELRWREGASWVREDEAKRARPQLAAVAEVPAESPRKAKQSDADLRDQIESLVKVCEQLLRERAEERGRKTQNSPRERHSPSPRRPKETEDVPKVSGPGSARGQVSPRGQASPRMPASPRHAKASRNTGTEWRGPAQAQGSTPVAAASDMHTWGEKPAEAAPPSASGPDWPDSLSELLQGQSRMIPSDIPEAYAVYQNYSDPPVAVAHGGLRRAVVEESPFASPARGIAIRRSSRSYRRDSGGVGWGGRMLASPPLISRGGLNVQASWEPSLDGHPFKGPQRSKGPGQVPIGINPSIQAQSAMLREMYPNVAMGGPGPGPLRGP